MYESNDTFGSVTETFKETIINTNAEIWTIPEFPSFTTIFQALSTAISAILVLATKRIAKRKTKLCSID